MLRPLAPLSWTFTPAARFREHSVVWDRLNAETFNTPLLASTFVGEALAQFGHGSELLAVANLDGVPVAACLLQRRTPLHWQTFDASQLPLCTWLQRPDFDSAKLLASLLGSLPRHVILLSMIRMDPMKTPRPQSTLELSTIENIVTGQIELPGTFEAYLGVMPKKFVAKVRKRRLKAQQTLGPIELLVAHEPEDVANAVREFALLEASGWKHAAGTAVAVGGEQFGFYQAAMRAMAHLGEARVFTLRIGPRVAAAQLALVRGSRMYLLKSTYDETLREFGPGVLLKWLLIEAAYDTSPPIRRIELYGRLIESHRPFVTGSRETYHVNYFRARLVAWLHSRVGRLRRRAAA
jgi:CelD/BcsL family acetyltransferase involved in cellulose biosynthesis